MKRLFGLWVLFLALSCLVVPAASQAAEVAQGKVIAVDAAAKTLTIEEFDTNISHENPYGRPTGITSVYRTEGALVGIPPEPGDVVRIAYETKGSERIAILVMNVSKQDLRKK